MSASGHHISNSLRGSYGLVLYSHITDRIINLIKIHDIEVLMAVTNHEGCCYLKCGSK